MSIGNELVDLADRSLARWHDPIGLFSAWAVAAAATAFTPLNWPANAIVVLLLWLTITGAWLWTRRPPRPRSGRVGIAVVIAPDETPSEKAFSEDFISEIRRLLLRGRAGTSFQVVVAPPHVSRRQTVGDA